MERKLATKVMDLNGQAGFGDLDGPGFGAVYLVTPPMKWSDSWEEDAPKYDASYVWVHAVDVPFSGPETYIFPCDEKGKVLDWCELEGSFRGRLDLEEALHRAGYEVA